MCLLGLLLGSPATAVTQVVLNMPTDPAAQEHVINQKIDDYFPAPVRTVMRRIAECESGREHVEPNGPHQGTLLRNDGGGSARGAFQVLMRIHRPEMARMELDPDNIDDYMTYVVYLYETFGTKPWNPSRKCWGTASTIVLAA